MSRASEGITACPENYANMSDMLLQIVCQKIPTPAMNKPKATPRPPQLSIPNWVSAGLHKLPGPSVLEKPSMKITAMIDSVEIMPIMLAYERRDRGMKTVGIKLRAAIIGQVGSRSR